MSASCLTRQQTPAEIKALEDLRVMTRGGVLPAEDIVARLESAFPRTKTAALARMVRARIKIRANDFAAAAALLDADAIRDHTSIGDYALFMRANAFEKAGRLPEARIVYEQLTRDYPSSIRAREAILRDADLLMRTGAASAVPTLLKELAKKDDATALLLTAKAFTQAADSARALVAYRRIYFFAPASAESTQAAIVIPQLNGTVLPFTADEAVARAEKLYDAKKYDEALQAYTDALMRFPVLTNPQNQLRRGISASNVGKTMDAVTALDAVPSSAGETRAEALQYLAIT